MVQSIYSLIFLEIKMTCRLLHACKKCIDGAVNEYMNANFKACYIVKSHLKVPFHYQLVNILAYFT
jgi:hypothetical protein